MTYEYSANHAKITGEFGEHLVLYWLSKNGYESVHAQYIGIDIIASRNGKRIGISVKSRSRKEGRSDYSLTIGKPLDQIQKVKNTCLQFACEPYFAFVIDQLDSIKVVVTPLEVIETCYIISAKSTQDWNILKFEKNVRTSSFELKWDAKGSI
jgi:Holliday junction resolvase-like predicted endonuclease